jgi:hypothetical protein
MREETHESPQKSRAVPGAPFVLVDFLVFMLCTLAFPWVGMRITQNLLLTARLPFFGHDDTHRPQNRSNSVF